MRILFTLILFLVFFCISCFSQDTYTISGTVTYNDSGEGGIGVNVIVLNTQPTIGAITDLDGYYLIKEAIPIGQTELIIKIQFQYIGYKSITKMVTLHPGNNFTAEVNMKLGAPGGTGNVYVAPSTEEKTKQKRKRRKRKKGRSSL